MFSQFYRASVHHGENKCTADTRQDWTAKAVHIAGNQEAESVRNQGPDTVFKGPTTAWIHQLKPPPKGSTASRNSVTSWRPSTPNTMFQIQTIKRYEMLWGNAKV